MSALQLRLNPDGRLELAEDGSWTAVRVVRCFPWTRPDALLSLRDEDGNERAFVATLDDLDPAAREVLRHELSEAARTFVITALHAVEKEIELRCWEVDTDAGPRSFQTELDEWPRALPGGGLLIQDLFGDLYRIPDPEALDPRGRKILWPLLA